MGGRGRSGVLAALVLLGASSCGGHYTGAVVRRSEPSYDAYLGGDDYRTCLRGSAGGDLDATDDSISPGTDEAPHGGPPAVTGSPTGVDVDWLPASDDLGCTVRTSHLSAADAGQLERMVDVAKASGHSCPVADPTAVTAVLYFDEGSTYQEVVVVLDPSCDGVLDPLRSGSSSPALVRLLESVEPKA